MPKITIPSILGTLSESLGTVLDGINASIAAAINANARYRGPWLGTMDVKTHDLVFYQGNLWDALVDSVNVTPVEGASWRRVVRGLGTGSVQTDDIGIGQIAKEQLDYAVATDITLTLTANVWADFIAAQTFTIDRADSRQPYVTPFGNVGYYPASGSGRVAMRALIDNTTSIPMSGSPFNTNPVNVLAGCGITPLDGLTAGSHTIKIQVMAEQAGMVYCRATSAIMLENYRMRVVEGKR